MLRCFISCSPFNLMAPSSRNIEDRGGVGGSLCCAQVIEDAAVCKHASKTGDTCGCCCRRPKASISARNKQWAYADVFSYLQCCRILQCNNTHLEGVCSSSWMMCHAKTMIMSAGLQCIHSPFTTVIHIHGTIIEQANVLFSTIICLLYSYSH